MTEHDIQELAQEALDAAARLIQDRLGAPSGDLAGLFFSGETLESTLTTFARYIQAEAQELAFSQQTNRIFD